MTLEEATQPETLREVSLVVPVYQGEHTLASLVAEVLPLTVAQTTPNGRRFRVIELAQSQPFVRPIWLSRNFGQHAATFAGLASTVGEWVVTLYEDGQQAPADIAKMLDRALEESARLVYANPTNLPPTCFPRLQSGCSRACSARTSAGSTAFG
jgi:glycosyltransferase involved in cell wall biosynthesis